MKTILLFSLGQLSLYAAAETNSVPDLRTNGAFGFPQREAKVLCDTPALRFSVYNNSDHFYAQAVLWDDGDGSIGKTEDNREIGDWSGVMLDLDGDGQATREVDRSYSLNPWPTMQGLHYQVLYDRGSSSGLNKDSKGQGAVRYVKLADGKTARVDSFLIPMPEMGRKVGDRIRLCYWGHSPTPELTVNSVGYEREGKRYYKHNIPWTNYHDYALAEGKDIDTARVPEGRKDIALATRTKVPIPEVGDAAPEISANKWVNLKEPATLAGLRGKVVLVEFWATWCGPCIQAIPHLNELHEKNAGKKFQLLSFVVEGHKTMDKFLARTPVKYPIGLESGSLDAYGITGIPHAFVIDQAGKIVWHGHSASPEMEKAIERALEKAELGSGKN